LLAGAPAALADEDYDHGYQSYQRGYSQPESSNGIGGYNAARDYERPQQMQRDDDARRQQMLRDSQSSTPSGRNQSPRSEVSPAPSEEPARPEASPQPQRRYARTHRRTAFRYRCGAYRCAPRAAIFAPFMFRLVAAQLRRRIR
jgi:hypothetical protein